MAADDNIIKKIILVDIINNTPGGKDYLTLLTSIFYLLPTLITPIGLYFSTNIGWSTFAYSYTVFIFEALLSALFAWVIPSNWYCNNSDLEQTVTFSLLTKLGKKLEQNIIHQLYYPLGIIISVMFSVGAMTAYIWNSYTSILGSSIALFVGVGLPLILYVLTMIGVWKIQECDSRLKIASGVVSFVGLLLGYGVYLLNSYLFPQQTTSSEPAPAPPIKHNKMVKSSQSKSSTDKKHSTNKTRSIFQKTLIGVGVAIAVLIIGYMIYSVIITNQRINESKKLPALTTKLTVRTPLA